ncbi:MAG: energy transducer TonB [Candidatus Omnitrophica bacterium]|nr:energy transducer TonB [Candidatus Omnitrophota bacterium]
MEHSSAQFKVIILISIFIHAVFLLELPRFKIIPPKKSLTNLEVTYKILKLENALNKKLKQNVNQREDLSKLKKNRLLLKAGDMSSPPAFSQKADLLSTGKVIVRNVQLPTRKEKSPIEIVKLPVVSSPFMSNPAYLSYYQIIREKIKNVAHLNNTLVNEGEVYLSFVVDSSGQLITAKVVNEKSTNNQELQYMAHSFLEKAAPFPVFPPKLKHQQLSFNVIIEFRLVD